MPTRVLVRAGMKLSVLGRRLLATKKYCPLLLLLGVFCQVSALPQSPNSEFQRLSQLVQQRYQAGDLDGAITNYQRAVKLDPQSETAYSGLDAALLDRGLQGIGSGVGSRRRPAGKTEGDAPRFDATVPSTTKPRPFSAKPLRSPRRTRIFAPISDWRSKEEPCRRSPPGLCRGRKAQGHLEAPGHATLTHPRDRSFSFRGQCPTLGVWHGHHVPLRCRDSV